MLTQVLLGQMLPAPDHPLHLIINPQIFGQGSAKHDHGADVLGGVGGTAVVRGSRAVRRPQLVGDLG